MKTLFIFTTILCLSLTTTMAQDSDANRFKINGVVYLDERMPNEPGDSVFLSDNHINGNIIQATTLQEDGSFTFSGTVKKPFLATISVDKGSRAMLNTYVEPGNINVEINIPYKVAGSQVQMVNRIGGTPLNEALQKHNEALYPIMKMDLSVSNLKYSELEQSVKDPILWSLYDSIKSVSRTARYTTFKENKDNILGAHMLLLLLYNKNITLEEFSQTLKSCSEEVKQYPEIRELYNKNKK